MGRLTIQVVPFVWSSVAVEFVAGTASTVDLAAYLQNPEDRVVAYSVAGVLPAGVTLVGSQLRYNGAGAATSAAVVLMATEGQYVAASYLTAVTIAPAPVVNLGPTWVGAPASLGTFIAGSGGTVQLSQWTRDAEGDAIRYFRTGSGADTAPGSVAVNQTTGALTVPASLGASGYAVEVRLVDAQGNIGQTRAFSFTVTTAGAATHTVSVSGSTVTTRRVSTGQTWTGADINATTCGIGPGSVVEFASGTYPLLKFVGWRGTAANKVIARPAAGALVIISTTSSSFRWWLNDVQHLTIDGATTNPNAALPIPGAPARCGFRLTGAAACTGWIKAFSSTHLPKGVTLQYIEIAGSNFRGICVQFNSANEMSIEKFPNEWIEDTAIRYCYFHDAGGMYLGTNYENDETNGLKVPHRRTTVEYCRIVNPQQECVGLKKHWEGPNYIRFNYFEGAGRDSDTSVDQRNAISIQNSTAYIYGNRILNSGQGNAAQGGGSGPNGLLVVGNNGPDIDGIPICLGANGAVLPQSSYSAWVGANRFPFWEVWVFSNVICGSAWNGMSANLGTLNGNKGPGVANLVPQKLHVFSNTFCSNLDAGVRVKDAATVVAGSSIDNNICIGNGAAFSGYASTLAGSRNKTSGDSLTSLFVDAENATWANRDYHLTKAVPVTAGSVLGTTVATTDMDGDTRVLASADMGAYEYP